MQSQRNTKQLIFDKQFLSEKSFGGALLKKSHAKKPRPISTKKAMHLTLRSTKAKGTRSFLLSHARALKIEKSIRTQANKFGVKIYRYANVGNHLHLLLLASQRKGFINFLRSISGIIARIALGAEKGQAKLEDNSKFWDQRPWTRILAWMKDFKNVSNYVRQNFLESIGFIAYKPRKHLSTS